jgi:hypothetical protein
MLTCSRPATIPVTVRVGRLAGATGSRHSVSVHTSAGVSRRGLLTICPSTVVDRSPALDEKTRRPAPGGFWGEFRVPSSFRTVPTGRVEAGNAWRLQHREVTGFQSTDTI